MPKVKKEPLRKCLVTNTQHPKKDLFRIVRTPEGNVVVDLKGKLNGRGAYISKSIEAIKIARTKKVLDRQLEVKISEEIYEEMIGLLGDNIEK
ncbi:MAG TPA: YlxR family protein [Acholeplasmataceae bacterium]|nr:YlxR family protein [Acholeplasmataceae bacterium]